MSNEIAKVDNTPPEAYNPAGMFQFHSVRIATSMTDLSKTQTVVCRDFVVSTSTVTMYSIHKPYRFNAYQMGIMNETLFGCGILELAYNSRYVDDNKPHVCHNTRRLPDEYVSGYTLLESKTINVNRLDDAESHSNDPIDGDNVWYKKDKERATEILTKRKLVFEARLQNDNEKFVSEDYINHIYNELLKFEQREANSIVCAQNREYIEEAKQEYDKAIAGYQAKWKIVRLFTDVPEQVEPKVAEPKILTEVSKYECKRISNSINRFNEETGKLLDLTHVFAKFGQPSKKES